MKKEDNKDTYDDLLQTCNKSLYEQSSKLSTICRGMVYAIIATIWAVSYKDGVFHMPEGWFLWTIFLCGMYIFADIMHYFLDTSFYFKSAQHIFRHRKLTTSVSKDDANKFVKNSRRSYYFLCAKYGLSIIILMLFVTSMIFYSFA